jgi:hypothetical protein
LHKIRVALKGVSGGVQTVEMTSIQRKYIVTRRFNLDFEIVVQGRNEEEAAYSADSIELESWNEVDSSWELIDVSRVSHLVLVEDKEERETSKPVIKVWERT